MENMVNTSESTEVSEPVNEVELLASILRAQRRTNRLLEENRKNLLTIKRIALFFLIWTLASLCLASIPIIFGFSTILRMLSSLQH